MKGKIRNRIDKVCPYCGCEVIIYELDDDSPSRTDDSVLCPTCKERIHEGCIVGEFVSELKSKQEGN